MRSQNRRGTSESYCESNKNNNNKTTIFCLSFNNLCTFYITQQIKTPHHFLILILISLYQNSNHIPKVWINHHTTNVIHYLISFKVQRIWLSDWDKILFDHRFIFRFIVLIFFSLSWLAHSDHVYTIDFFKEKGLQSSSKCMLLQFFQEQLWRLQLYPYISLNCQITTTYYKYEIKIKWLKIKYLLR